MVVHENKKSACSAKGIVKWTKKHPTVMEKILSH